MIDIQVKTVFAVPNCPEFLFNRGHCHSDLYPRFSMQITRPVHPEEKACSKSLYKILLRF